MSFDLTGRHALVTGAASGVGRAVALALARAGVTVLAGHRQDGEAAHSLARLLKETGDDHRVVLADPADDAGIAAIVASIRGVAGSRTRPPHSPDTTQTIIVVLAPDDHAEPASLAEHWQRALTGPVRLIDAVAPLLSAGASVVTIGSTLGARGAAGAGPQAAAGAALVGLTRCWAKELGPAGVRANLIAVGPAVAGNPAGIAAVALFLASDAAAGVNGETFTVDGGE